MKKTRIIDVEALKASFTYDAETGTITKKSTGDVVGRLNKDGYLVVSFQNTHFLAHRVAYCLHFGANPEGVISHANGIRTDNRIGNLREFSREEFVETKKTVGKKLAKHSAGGGGAATAVRREDGSWAARFYCFGRYYRFGRFETSKEARKQAQDARRVIERGPDE